MRLALVAAALLLMALPASRPTARLAAHRAPATQSAPIAPPTDRFPFIRGRVDDESAPNGAWLNWETRLTPWPARLRGKEAWRPVFEALSVFLKQSPALASMREVYPWLSYGVDDGFQPLPRGQISMVLWSARWVEPAPGTPAGLRLKSGAGGFTPSGFDAWINWFPTSPRGASTDLVSADWYTDAQGSFFRLAPPDRLIDGFPVHGGWLFVIEANKPPLFTPVSQERVLKAYMAQAERLMAQAGTVNADLAEALAAFTSAEMRSVRRQAIEEAVAGESNPARAAAKRAQAERDDAEQERQLRDGAAGGAAANPVSVAARAAHDRWAQRLAGMSAAERGTPARVRDDPEALLLEDLALAGDRTAVDVMQYNPAFVNKALGPAVPQLLLLAIGSSTDAQRQPGVLARMPVHERVPIALVERSRWSELQALLR